MNICRRPVRICIIPVHSLSDMCLCMLSSDSNVSVDHTRDICSPAYLRDVIFVLAPTLQSDIVVHTKYALSSIFCFMKGVLICQTTTK